MPHKEAERMAVDAMIPSQPSWVHDNTENPGAASSTHPAAPTNTPVDQAGRTRANTATSPPPSTSKHTLAAATRALELMGSATTADVNLLTGPAANGHDSGPNGSPVINTQVPTATTSAAHSGEDDATSPPLPAHVSDMPSISVPNPWWTAPVHVPGPSDAAPEDETLAALLQVNLSLCGKSHDVLERAGAKHDVEFLETAKALLTLLVREGEAKGYAVRHGEGGGEGGVSDEVAVESDGSMDVVPAGGGVETGVKSGVETGYGFGGLEKEKETAVGEGKLSSDEAEDEDQGRVGVSATGQDVEVDGGEATGGGGACTASTARASVEEVCRQEQSREDAERLEQD